MKAKVYDLSKYLEEQKSTIKLGDDTYEISDGFNDLLKVDALSNKRDEMDPTEFVKEFLRITLGEAQADKLIEKNYKFDIYVKIMNCIEETYSGDADQKEGASSEDKNTELV